MAAIPYQPPAETPILVTISELQRELHDTWSQVQDASGKAASLMRMEKEVQRAGANLQDVEKGIHDLEHFVALNDQPGALSRAQLEKVVEMMAGDRLPVDLAAKNLERMSELVAQLEKLAEQMEETDRFAFRDLINLLGRYASRWRDGQKRIQTLEQHWQDGMLSMRVLGELGKRRPLSKTERRLLLRASVIRTPVIQDPSDSREDLYY